MAVGQRLFIEDIQGSAFDSLPREGFDHCTFADYGPSADADQYCVLLHACEIMRRKSLAKYRIAAKANSPSDGLKTPLPFVSVTPLAINSGNSVRSRPAEREWIQRKRCDIRNTWRIRERRPDQFRMTSTSAATCSKARAESPTTIVAT